MENKGIVLGNWPKLLKQLRRTEYDSDRLRLPGKFIENYGEQIPANVRLQLPNGREIDVQYNQNEQTLYHIDELVKDFREDSSIMLVLSYKGNGNFFVNILNDAMTEIEYGSITAVPEAPVYPQGRVGWKFISVQNRQMFMNGGVEVPQTFVDRFENSIPAFITIGLRNGEVFPGSFMNNFLYGLRPLVKKRYIQHFDTVMFTYCGAGRFGLCIFDKFKIEKALDVEIVEIDSGSESYSDSDCYSDKDDEINDTVNQMDIVSVAEAVKNVERSFSLKMSVSNTNSTSHGVYIPRNINPIGRSWIVGEEVVLRTDAGIYSVRVVNSNGKARFSSGWNKFVMENDIKFEDTVCFTLIEDDDERCIFDVEVQ